MLINLSINLTTIQATSYEIIHYYAHTKYAFNITCVQYSTTIN